MRARQSDASSRIQLRDLADRAFSRAAGAPLLSGNAVQILRDATENYPAWREALRAAKRYIHFESYIFSDDEVGRGFAELLAERARAGVKVRVLYDWLGTWGASGLWKMLRAAGAEVRGFNRPHLESPLGWVSRDHRKTIVVDGEVGFVTGLCVSARWLGRPEKGISPWRDTGMAIRGPAVAELVSAFAAIWAMCGPPHEPELADPRTLAAVGDVALRVMASVPNAGGVYRLDQVIAALARRRLWLTDAYFVGLTAYVQALGAAARDGVDVRLLVPGASDIPGIAALSRSGYHQLLEAGVRVFEWNGTMLHAKTAVADDRWSRIGSTNLNIASWLANYELDVAIEDEGVARTMAEMYEEDLGNATEVVLTAGRRTPRPRERQKRARPWQPKAGSGGRAAAGALGIGSVVGAAVTNRRELGPAEASMLLTAGVLFLALAGVGFVWPRVLAFPIAFVIAGLAVTILSRGWRLRKAYREARRARQDPHRAGRRRGREPGSPPVDESKVEPKSGPARGPARAPTVGDVTAADVTLAPQVEATHEDAIAPAAGTTPESPSAPKASQQG